MSASKHAARGLTLLELAVVLAVGALLVTLAVPSASDWIARQRLRAVTQQLVADLGDARHESARLAQPVHITFRAGSTWCYAVATNAQADCEQPGAGVLKVVRSTDHPGVRLMHADTQSFDDRSGTAPAAAGRIDFASRRGDQLSVRLSRLGRPSLCTPSASLPDVGPC